MRTRIVDVARAAGVSAGTVSRVLSGPDDSTIRVAEDTAARVRRVAEDLGYRPSVVARQLRGKSSRLVAVFIDPNGTPNNSRAVQAMETLAHERGYRLLLAHPMADEARVTEYVDDFLARNVDGLVCVHHAYPEAPHIVPKHAARMKRVVYISLPTVPDVPYVTSDTGAAFRLMTEHVIGRGRTRPALVLPRMGWPGSELKERAFREALQQHGLEQRASSVWAAGRDGEPEGQMLRPATVPALVDRLVVDGGADALLFSNDLWAAAVMQELKRRGLRIPDDVAVASNNNLELARFLDPPLTCIDPRLEVVATQALARVLDAAEAGQPVAPEAVYVAPELVVREST